MCSIIEAWGDNDFPQMTGRNTMPSATDASMNGVRTNQMAMDAQRMSRQATDLNMIQNMSMYPQGDKVGQPVTWADNRRQYARPSNELMNINGGESPTDNGWQTAYCKPRPDMNSMTRGVHSRYSREKRINTHTAELPYGEITTDVDPVLITGDASGNPGYLDLYSKGYEGRKWMPNMQTTTTRPEYPGDARHEAGINPSGHQTTTTGYTSYHQTTKPQTTKQQTTSPTAANDVPERFMGIADDTFTDMSMQGANSQIKSPFTEEVITDPRLIAENLAARTQQLYNTSKIGASNNASPSAQAQVTPIPDEIRVIQNQLSTLVNKMNTLEQKVNYVENNKSHDIILFIVIAIFILFVLDNVFKLGKFS